MHWMHHFFPSDRCLAAIGLQLLGPNAIQKMRGQPQRIGLEHVSDFGNSGPIGMVRNWYFRYPGTGWVGPSFVHLCPFLKAAFAFLRKKGPPKDKNEKGTAAMKFGPSECHGNCGSQKRNPKRSLKCPGHSVNFSTIRISFDTFDQFSRH